MSKGWEVAIRVQDNSTGFGSTAGVTSRPGWYLYVDSETLAKNAGVKERDNKIIPTRLSPVQTASLEQYSPGGEVTFQPRTDDCLNVLFAFFQAATFLGGTVGTVTGAGSWQFVPVNRSLAWSGVSFAGNPGTSVYSINVDKYFGNGLSGSIDGYRFERGIVSKLTFDQMPSEDLKVTADMRFLQHSEQTFGTGFKSQPNSLGSFSSKGQLVDWNATLSVAGVSTYPIEKIKFEFDNSITERRKLGQKGFYQFPFGRAIVSGEFDMEVEDLTILQEGTTAGTLICNWQTSDGDFLRITCPNIFMRASDAKVSDPGPVMQTYSFRAYPTGFGSSNAAVVDVYPKYAATLGVPVQSKLYF